MNKKKRKKREEKEEQANDENENRCIQVAYNYPSIDRLRMRASIDQFAACKSVVNIFVKSTNQIVTVFILKC